MNVKRRINPGAFLGGTAFVFAIGPALGEQAPPTENKGVQISAPDAIDLTPWANDMNGRQLRIRKFTMAPGGVLGVHSHDDRPDASYLVQGTLTEHRSDGHAEVRPKETFHTAGKGVTHWVENTGSDTAILIVVDVLKQP